MGSVIPLKKSANSAYLELKNLVGTKLEKVENLVRFKLKSNVGLIEKMSDHHLKSGGKRLRALLTLGSAKLSGYELGDRDINLAACVELIHAATLMHDDVLDNGEIRRGKKTINSIWGNHASILVGDYLLSRCFEMMVEDGNLEVLKLLSMTSAKIAQGEVLQLQHKSEIDTVEETYLEIITSKTAALFSAACKVGAILGNKDEKVKEALSSYGKNLGVTFQIADDTLDYNSDMKKFGKKIGKDFYEGKITLPIIILNQQCKIGEIDMLKDFFSKKERTENDLKNTLDLIKKYNVIKQCYKKADHFISLASSSLNIFESSEQKNILKNLTSFSIERSF